MRWPVNNTQQLQGLLGYLSGHPIPFHADIKTGEEKRTDAQNKTIHKWFHEIAEHLGDTTTAEVKAECNLQYGLPIKMRDYEWATVFGYIFRDLDYRRKIKAIRVLDIPFTRSMGVKELSEYMEQMQRDYTMRGVRLTIPEDRA